MREVLDRLKAQLTDRLPQCRPVGFGGDQASVSKVELTELGAVASAARDYLEAELIYRQVVTIGTQQETA